MTASASLHSTMRDIEQDLAPYDSNGQPQEAYLHLTRRMENEELGFDVDTTILDFFVYKATRVVFEWRSGDDRYHSDLPDALVNMTAGIYNLITRKMQY